MMKQIQAFTVSVGILLAAHTVMAVKVNVEFDKAFAFKDVHSWDWNPISRGDVFIARTPDDKPENFKKLAEPVILSAVADAMGRTKLPQRADGPDVTLAYYLVLTAGASAQTMGQFLPTNAHFGIPLFPYSTSSLEIVNQGALVLDFSSKGTIVWRGIAHAKVSMDADQKKRESILRDAVQDVLKRFPPK